MGYELAFCVSEIDEEFHCSICTMVLEHPMQSPCEHTFCNECIKGWLKVDASCPVDRCSLSLDNLKPTPRYFRNMLDKVEIRCSFVGCQTIIQLEHLQDHLKKCLYNPNSEVTCDKGCNIKMPRRDYETKNCFTHLANRVDRQQEHFESIITLQQEQIAKLSDEINRQREEMKKLNDEVSHSRGQQKHSNNAMSRQQGELAKLIDKPNILIPTKITTWQICQNMKISSGRKQILEFGGSSGNAFAQLFYSLEPSNSCFKIHVLNEGTHNSIAVGLTRKGHPTYEAPGNYEDSIGYRCSGEVFVNKRCQMVGQEWKYSDVIECGIIFPSNSANGERNRVEFYFTINKRLIFKNVLTMPQDGYFPTVFMWGAPVFRIGSYIDTFSKLEYLSN